MFVQVLRGRVDDAPAVRAALDRWRTELQPGAHGYLGATGGVTDAGTFIAVVRFASAETARSNSERPEQGAWWGQEWPAEVLALVRRVEELTDGVEYLDLRDPWLYS